MSNNNNNNKNCSDIAQQQVATTRTTNSAPQNSSSSSVQQQVENPRQMLVTGSAGFIGYHLALKLATEEFNYWSQLMDDGKFNHHHPNELTHKSVIIGIDNFNDYYSTDLKYMRRKMLQDAIANFNEKLSQKSSNFGESSEDNTNFIHFELIEGDVCDTTLLQSIFARFKFTHILHMAAQAGVRYSIENPQTYIRNNILCQIELLEVAVKHQKDEPPVFIYASSSSVYGNIQEFDPSPFHEGMNVNKPSNVYSASKIAQELFAETYNYLYNVPVIGLRFFTVYGEAGRLDMALFKWVDQIVKGQPITLYTTDNNKELMRDFTYVEDIVHGIVNSMKYGERVRREEGRAVHDVFNLGNNKPERVVDLIKYIETALDKKAIITLSKKPPTDMTMTYADITHSQKLLNYEPKTKLQVGVQKFVKWYLDHYHFSKKSETDNVIFTTYFVTKGHPERDEHYHDACFEPMKEWYDSVHKHNLRAVIFYDDAKLYNKCRFDKLTSYNVKFELVQLGNRSTNDERFFVYEQYLKRAQQRSTTGLNLVPKRILMTDLFDIRFNRDPFEYMASFDTPCLPDNQKDSPSSSKFISDKLFIGSEPTTIRSSIWAQQKLAQCGITIDQTRGTFYYNASLPAPFNTLSHKETSLDSILLNPGIVGGSSETVFRLLSIYNEFLKASPVQANCNTPVFNMLMYQHEEFQNNQFRSEEGDNMMTASSSDHLRYITGQPLHTVFKAFDLSDTFYIKHK
ncbi:hypothetical protein FDP41_004746 [Naegleria fowleri]|uniref:NAD(P)-binding domain-containing protein n=1 Tax=Naegleria fowleri TaxID=5763 RepID=A0A6A5BQ99_NAEFO|nr:uncharacterized protein FDP41_004746 [Naegleria fowleri]KAF0976070.1 hypothetical protein FDP41_004746 [Naegleria fowleri]CAG4712728.1 unnamed protein product [Naegleria fowleri]